MKIVEVTGIMVYIALLILNMKYCTIFIGFKTLSSKDQFVARILNIKKTEVVPPCVKDPLEAKEWLANSVEWMLIETLIFAIYTATLLFLMMKSRFTTIGMDQSG